MTSLSLQALTLVLVSQLLTLVANSIAFLSRGRSRAANRKQHGSWPVTGTPAGYTPARARTRLRRHQQLQRPRRTDPWSFIAKAICRKATACTRPFTPRNPRFVACPEMWHHYVFDRAINTTGLSPAGSQNCRLLHLGGTLSTGFRHRPDGAWPAVGLRVARSGRRACLNKENLHGFHGYQGLAPARHRDRLLAATALVQCNLWGRPLDTAMMDPWFREQFTDAHAIVVSDQPRAGLDILTTGDYHLDEDVAGRSWHHYPLQRWKGLEHEELQTERTRSPLLSYPVGTMLDSIYKTWRWPRVVGKVEHDPKNPLEYAKIWRIAQQAIAASGKPVKFGTCSAQVLAFFLDSHTPHYDLDDKKQLIWDMAEAMNRELRQLAASGCKVIQVEEPTLHFMARYNPEKKELLDFLVEAFNREVEGLDDVEVWIHTCWGNPNMQKVFSDESYANSVEIYLERFKGDVWTIEATENDFKELPLFAPYKNSLKKKIAVGVISHRTLQADFPEVIAGRIRGCLKYIPADKLVLSTDCGFGRQGFNRHLAFYKTVGIPLARNIVLRELGVEPRYVPAADERLAWDVLPDYEPFTHSPPLR